MTSMDLENFYFYQSVFFGRKKLLQKTCGKAPNDVMIAESSIFMCCSLFALIDIFLVVQKIFSLAERFLTSNIEFSSFRFFPFFGLFDN